MISIGTNRQQKVEYVMIENLVPKDHLLRKIDNPLGFFYLDHRTVDSRFNIITDTFVTPGNVNAVVKRKENTANTNGRLAFFSFRFSH